MAVATYGSENYYSVISSRRGALQRPLQIALIAGDFVALMLSYFAASGLYRLLVAEQEQNSEGPDVEPPNPPRTSRQLRIVD